MALPETPTEALKGAPTRATWSSSGPSRFPAHNGQWWGAYIPHQQTAPEARLSIAGAKILLRESSNRWWVLAILKNPQQHMEALCWWSQLPRHAKTDLLHTVVQHLFFHCPWCRSNVASKMHNTSYDSQLTSFVALWHLMGVFGVP